MKNLITTLAIGLSMLNAKAEHSSVLKLKMFDNGIFSVVLDDQPSCEPAAMFSNPHINPGYHKLKVIRFVNTPYSYYPVKQVVYHGWINIPAQSKVFASINCHNQFDILKVEPKFHHHPGNGYGYGYNNDYDDDCEYDENCWEPSAPPVPVCMAPANFMNLKQSIASKSFDSSRMEIAKQALAYGWLSAAQVADLARMFSFDSTRLEFAKMAFGKTVDKQNYFLVNDVFTFESSIGELNEYLAMGK